MPTTNPLRPPLHDVACTIYPVTIRLGYTRYDGGASTLPALMPGGSR